MVWLWLLFPGAVLAAAGGLWWANAQLAARHRRLQTEVDRLATLGVTTRSRRETIPTSRPGWPEQVHG